MSVINTNITSMIAQQNLNDSKGALETNMERLSSGLRINSAKDDAAGQAIANRMSSQITGLGQAQRNANDGISLAQTAEGGLDQINDNLQRVRELTVQAQNGTNSASDIDSIQQEVNQRLEEIDRIAQETDFNGTRVLDQDSETSIKIQVGSEDGQTIDIKINDQKGWNQFSETGTAASSLAQVGGEDRSVAALGFDVRAGDAGTASTTVDGTETSGIKNGESVSFVENGDGELLIKDETTASSNIDATEQSGLTLDGGTATFKTDDTTGEAYVNVSSTSSSNDGSYAITKDMVADDGTVTLDVTAESTTSPGATSTITGSSENVTVQSTEYYAVTQDMVAEDGTAKVSADLDTLSSIDAPASESAFGSSGETDVAVKGEPLDQIDDALAAVDEQRSQLGAIQNRFESAITNLSTNETNLSDAQSRIEDADYANEVADMTKNQILQQAGTSVLAQANQLPQNALSLLG